MICISCGDPAGIGPEVVFKSIKTLPRHDGMVVFLDRQSLETYGSTINIQPFQGKVKKNQVYYSLTSSNLLPIMAPNHPVNAKIAYDALMAAIDCCETTHASLVTGPISKAGFLAANIPFKGHTPLLMERFKCPNASMGFYSSVFSVVLATVHDPIHVVESKLTPELITNTIKNAVLFSEQLGISNPKIAVSGLNPHAGELGVIGNFEKNILIPTLQSIRPKLSAKIVGPISPDTVFLNAKQGDVDMVVCMYHDQGLIPLKLLAFDSAVNVTLGLPICRTSPDHGTAYDIACTNSANPSAMRCAIEYALRFSAA
jgi:4-hydroxythreonine-4-phosphate dehydrogenase